MAAAAAEHTGRKHLCLAKQNSGRYAESAEDDGVTQLGSQGLLTVDATESIAGEVKGESVVNYLGHR